MKLSIAEQKVLDSFLEELSEYQSTAGCNDYYFPTNMSEVEKKEILSQLDDPDDGYGDSCILDIIRCKLDV